MNSSQPFKAGLRKPQHTSPGTSFHENGRVYAFVYTASMPAGSRRGLFTHVRSKQKARKPGLCISGPAGVFLGARSGSYLQHSLEGACRAAPTTGTAREWGHVPGY